MGQLILSSIRKRPIATKPSDSVDSDRGLIGPVSHQCIKSVPDLEGDAVIFSRHSAQSGRIAAAIDPTVPLRVLTGGAFIPCGVSANTCTPTSSFRSSLHRN